MSLPADITSLPNSIFDCCKSLKKINIPNKVISIGDYVFEFCNLQSITIPTSVKTIGKYAFSFNDNLNDVCCLAQIPPTFDNSNSINRKATIYVYQHTFEAYKSANDWKDYKIIGLSNEDMEDFSKNGFSKGINTDLKCGITSISGSSLKTFNLFVTNKNINAITITKIVAKNPTTEKQLTSLEDESKLGEVEGGDTKEFSVTVYEDVNPVYEIYYTYKGKLCLLKTNATDTRQYDLTIMSTGSGVVTCYDKTVNNNTETQIVDLGSTCTLVITPDKGYFIKSVTVNDIDVTAQIYNNSYTISDITNNTIVAVTFEELPINDDEHNKYITCVCNSISKIQSGSVVRVAVGLEMANSGTEDVEVTKLIIKDPDTNDMLYSTTDANFLGELKGGKKKTLSVQINQEFENIPICELLYNLNNKPYSYAASDYRILSLKANDYGYLTFSGVFVGNDQKKFSLKSGNKATIGIFPKEGGTLSKLIIDNSDMTSSVTNSQYTINDIISNTSVKATFDMNTEKIRTLNGHEYVDLGLPSGRYWSTLNYDATKPEDPGSYLSGVGDIITRQWGEYWTAPTKEDIQELIDNCKWTWTSINSMSGFKITGPNGNSLFFPAAGKNSGFDSSGTATLIGSNIYYLTSSVSGAYSWILTGNSSEYKLENTFVIAEKFTVRPIVVESFTKKYIKGDANGDGIVNVADIAEVVNYLKGNPSIKFDHAAADVDSSGDVTENDVSGIVNIIMSKK